MSRIPTSRGRGGRPEFQDTGQGSHQTRAQVPRRPGIPSLDDWTLFWRLMMPGRRLSRKP